MICFSFFVVVGCLTGLCNTLSDERTNDVEFIAYVLDSHTFKAFDAVKITTDDDDGMK